MTTTELIILVIASIALGTTIGAMITLTTMRHLLHLKDARIKILNEQLEKWNQHSIEREEQFLQMALELQKVPGTIVLHDLLKDVESPVDQVIADMNVISKHKEAVNEFWETEKELIQEDRRTPGSHQP